MEPVTDKAACMDAANQLGLDNDIHETDDAKRPEGCFVDGNNVVWLGSNPSNKGKGVVTLSEFGPLFPICHAKKDLELDHRFKIVTSGTCNSNGMLPIVVDNLCEAAASELGL